MTISEIELEMRINGVSEEDVAAIIAACKSKGFNSGIIDDELLSRGYDKIFSIDYDDEESDWEEDFASIEKFPHKQRYADD